MARPTRDLLSPNHLLQSLRSVAAGLPGAQVVPRGKVPRSSQTTFSRSPGDPVVALRLKTLVESKHALVDELAQFSTTKCQKLIQSGCDLVEYLADLSEK
jgi:hypothetical protein